MNQLSLELRELRDVRWYARNPTIYLEAPLNALYLMAVREYAPAAERARLAGHRLRDLGRLLDEARANLWEAARPSGGVDAAPLFVDTAVAVARSGVELLRHLLPVNLGQALAGEPRQLAAWQDAAGEAEAALLGYARWLEDELRPRAEGDFALGRSAFEVRVRCAHGLEDTAAEILAYGTRLKRETEQALARVAAEINPGRHWRDVASDLKGDHPAAGELIERYAEWVARARTFVVERELASIPEGESLEVTATPEHLKPLIPYAAYQAPGAEEAEQKGIFFVTPPPPDAPDEVLRDHSSFGIPVTALHEAYPGHHLQLTRANQAETLPRRTFWTAVFAEGWALYCEEMMWEQGFYQDPRQRLLQLKDLLWRACRVVVDVGLHVEGWSYDQAVDYMVGEAGLERPNAEIEVRRYCAEPTQPMSYAVGKREILALRERWRGAHGQDSSLREFHDRLLSWGTIPPPLVARGLGL